MSTGDLLSVAEVAALVGMSSEGVRKSIHAGRLAAQKKAPNSPRLFITAEDAAAYRDRILAHGKASGGDGHTFHDATLPPKAEARFWSKVQGGDVSDCWLWTGHVEEHGYGRFYLRLGGVAAHRVAYTHLRAEIPEGLQLDHTCHALDQTCTGKRRDCLHRRCVNPWHLEPVTSLVNNRRAARSSRVDACMAGHLYTEATTYVTKRGTRACRTCQRLWMLRRLLEWATTEGFPIPWPE